MGRSQIVQRRNFLVATGAVFGSAMVGGCDRIADSERGRRILASAEGLTRRVQRIVVRPAAFAPEYAQGDLSVKFRANGSTNPDDEVYQALAKNDFKDWRLTIGGLVENAIEYSLADLRSLPFRTQITRHDCVEGWSCIGKWTGVPLGVVLQRSRLQPRAKFIVFYCADKLEAGEAGRYYESIDIEDALHPQTILAYDMNDGILPIAHGAPLRLRVERQLGYKMAKYIMRIEAVESISAIAGGGGGFWEDRGYEWYAGI